MIKTNGFNARDRRIANIWNAGLKNPRKIAIKIGYIEEGTPAGVERVKLALRNRGILK